MQCSADANVSSLESSGGCVPSRREESFLLIERAIVGLILEDEQNVSENVVKSAARVLEVFEYFAGRKTPATVGEVCSALGYPQSSTSVLLKSLLTLGYLSYDQSSRRYAPSVKVASLSEWIPEHLHPDSLESPDANNIPMQSLTA